MYHTFRTRYLQRRLPNVLSNDISASEIFKQFIQRQEGEQSPLLKIEWFKMSLTKETTMDQLMVAPFNV
jgi:hypothetical protein